MPFSRVRGATVVKSYKKKKRNWLKFNQLRFFCGDSYRTQTCNLLIRSQMLYSIELRSQF